MTECRMSEQDAREMIAKICEWLAQGAPGNTVAIPVETAQADLARDFCGDLLRAADADGSGGYRLCMS